MDPAPRATPRRARGGVASDAPPAAAEPRPAVAGPGLAGAVAVVLGAAVVLRFLASSDLWLDEALAVNIARLPLGELPEALRHDGAPPLYYALLHGWMAVFGDGPVAVRSLSGVCAVGALPLAWSVGRRLGGPAVAWPAMLLLASSPFAIRYATEARMYALVVLLVLAGHLALARALERPALGRLAAVAAVTGALLLTHYWALFLAGAVVLALFPAARRPGEAGRAARRTLAAVAAGFAALGPWLPVLGYQVLNTGTPWAVRPGPREVADTLLDFAGGRTRAGTLLAAVLVALVVLALFGRPAGHRRLELGPDGRPGARPVAFVAAATLTAALAVALVMNSAFVSRYASVALAPLLLVAALGTTALPGAAARRAAVGLAVVLGLAGAGGAAGASRTQAGEVAELLARRAGPGDVVAYCPDQLGPAVSRLLPATLTQVTFPDFGPPALVDWVDYAERNKAAAPREFARKLLALAGPHHDVFVVWAGGYRTLGRRCEALVAGLDTRRPEVLRATADFDSFERMTLVQFPHW